MVEAILTMGELAKRLSHDTGASIPVWQARRVTDRLADTGQVAVERIACYRTVAVHYLPAIVAELRRMGVVEGKVKE